LGGNLRDGDLGFNCGVLARDGGIAGMLSCPSDSASSCFIISAFSDLFGFLASPLHVLSTIANTARVVTTPMQTMVVIDACFLDECGGKLQMDCPFLGLEDLGY